MKRLLVFLLISISLAGCAQTVPPASYSSQQGPQHAQADLISGPVKACLDQDEGGTAFTCFEDYLKKRVQEKDPVTAFADLRILYDISPVVQSFCHPLAHSIGHAGMEKYPVLSEAFSRGDNFCWAGYFHGVMETYVEKVGREALPSQMNTICNQVPGRENYSFDYYNCVHGLGHGVMSITNNELFDSLKLCDNLEGQWERTSCYGGVFMENVIVDNLNHYTAYLKPEEPLYPCTAVDDPYKESCYLMQTSYMLKVTNYDFKKVFGLCEQADKGYVETCYRSLGRDASGSSISDAEQTRAKCYLGKDYVQQSNCIVGAAKDFVSYFHSDIQAYTLCDSLDDKNMIQLCRDTVTEYYKVF